MPGAMIPHKMLGRLTYSEVEVEVDLNNLETDAVLDLLLGRNVISEDEAIVLKDGLSLGDHYEELFVGPEVTLDTVEDPRFDDIRALILRGDVDELLIQMERLRPEFDGLARLIARRA